MTLNLKVPKLACSACIDRVTKAVMSVDSSATVEANTKTKMVNVRTLYPEAQIKQVLVSAGYPPA
ncbi:MAG: heavy-metal-associated domain-containing protein [Cyanobacteria bacterium P01_D01_bin.116]